MMTILSSQKLQLIHDFYQIKVIKFGQFQLKTGMISPFYIDLRQLFSYPKLLSEAVNLLWQQCVGLSYDFICGIPYAALPMTTCLSLQQNIPMIMCRKEKKSYGTGQLIEGNYCPGQTCLIIEDVITSGNSIIETIVTLSDHQILVRDVAILIDRQQGGRENLQQHNLRVHTAFTVTEIFSGLFQLKILAEKEKIAIQEFFYQNTINSVHEVGLSWLPQT